ncbi:glycosyltransferase family 4 protein [Rhodococcus sp. X156]|uniref:glycosyltransferase family 4 protein n=1 Tax=Rhodococcus sp. X156 TaxID=2499145 RepID=UPI000FDB8EDD|nr:glycosyltransferase family 4 protein [Rhodococcus sp. X156]
MRITHVTDCYLPRLGGIEMQVHDLARRQRAQGHEVRVITRTAAEAPEDPAGPTVHRVPGFRQGVPGVSTRAALHRLLAPGEVDVVHAHASLVSPLVWTAGAITSAAGVPMVVTMHSVPPPGAILRVAGTAAGWTRWKARWTAVSQVAAKPMRYMLAGQEVAVLGNGVDAAAWQLPAHHADPRELTIVSVMRLAQRKRPMPLIRTLQAIRAQVPTDVRLRAVIMGEGPRRADMEKALRRRGMQDWVSLPGARTREEIRQVYRTADVYLAPARLESFGIAALEARSAGLPVVAMSCGGVVEFVRDGVEGLLVGSDADMAAATAGLLTAPERLRAIREHNVATTPEMTWGHMLARSMEHYQQAAVIAGTRLPDPVLARTGSDGAVGRPGGARLRSRVSTGGTAGGECRCGTGRDGRHTCVPDSHG